MLTLLFLFASFSRDLIYGLFWFCKACFNCLFLSNLYHPDLLLYKHPHYETNYVNNVKGGAVKYRFLYNSYKSSKFNFDIAYLVSSALPRVYIGIILYCLLFNKPIVYNQNGTAYFAWSGYKTLYYQIQLSFALYFSNFIIYQSDFCRISSSQHCLLASTSARLFGSL